MISPDTHTFYSLPQHAQLEEIEAGYPQVVYELSLFCVGADN